MLQLKLRRKALEEILYTLVVQKFMDADISLIPSISSSSSDPVGRVDTWPSQDEKWQQVHSPEAYEMIQNHLALILGNRLNDLSTVAQISKLRVGQVYAASVMYGYFLKRVDQRFQLEKAMKILPEQMEERERRTLLSKGKLMMSHPPLQRTQFLIRMYNPIPRFLHGLVVLALRDLAMG